MKLRCLVISVAVLFGLAVPAFGGCICIYDDGPTNGQYNAFFIDGPNSGPFRQSISDGFVATNSGTPMGLQFGLWVPSGLTPTTVTWWLGTSAFAGDLGSATVNNLDYTYLFTNAFGYDVFDVVISGLGHGSILAGQTYWLTLGNANDSGGTQFDAWDVNGGPAICNFAVGGQNFGNCGDGGEAFTFLVPEPGTLVMLGGGILAAAGALRRKIGF